VKRHGAWHKRPTISIGHRCGSMRTAVALGSNVGDRSGNLRVARDAILALPDVKQPILSSAIYETEPEKFLNAVMEFDYEGEPGSLLEQIIRIEEELGRRSDHPKNISRTIDIDLLYCGERKLEDARLQLPHPRMHLRSFVLQPLANIRPELILPGQIKTVGELLANLKESANVVRFRHDW